MHSRLSELRTTCIEQRLPGRPTAKSTLFELSRMFQHSVSLKEYHTFGLDVRAETMVHIASEDQLAALHAAGHRPALVLGEGSNVLFRGHVSGETWVNRIPGIEVVRETETHWSVRVGAGTQWHSFVMHAIVHGWGGVENLSLIPGSVGAAPMQNIGAYGVELKEVFESLEAFHLPTGEIHRFSKSDCQFGYRESVFKHRLKGEYFITRVVMRLSKFPEFRVTYGDIQRELESAGEQALSIRAISDAVIRIRQSKLPDPQVIGNAGSFFKNPIVPLDQYESVLQEHPNVVAYPAGQGSMKLAAGWLIDQAGWKGHNRDTHGVHDRQALVLVHHGGASGDAIYQLSQDILEDVERKYGVRLEREVNVIG